MFRKHVTAPSTALFVRAHRLSMVDLILEPAELLAGGAAQSFISSLCVRVTALVAHWTSLCHFGSPASPVVTSIPHSSLKKPDHAHWPPISSRRSMSCKPNQFVPLPSWLSDHTASRPPTGLCSSKNVSLVSSKSLRRGSCENLLRRTSYMAFQLLPKPPYVKSSRPRRLFFSRTACSPLRRWKSSAWLLQNLSAWNAASALVKVRAPPWWAGASRDMRRGLPAASLYCRRSQKLPRNPQPQSLSCHSRYPG
mmetsp:Transcript_18725/g.52905  ORF Transcript_18725/g.52905 Transcript_18725/m.52905 type:complete len:252 (+) Transcript_18725:359-1114(+)